MAHRMVWPRSELRVGGAVVTALRAQATFGYRSPVATMSATVAPGVYGWLGDEAVRLALGYRSGLTTRFAGRIKGNSLRWSPKGVEFRAVGPLGRTQKATGIEDIALAPSDPTLPPTTERWAFGMIDTTDGPLVAGLLALCGIADASVADAGVPFATLAPSLTSKYAVRLASDRAPYDLIKEIDTISGCQTFDGADGRVTRVVASGLPSGLAARTFTEGVDFSGQTASREWSGDEVYNQITVTGQGLTDPDTGLAIPISVTVSAPSRFVDDPPGTNEFTFQSDLIESYDVATALARRLLGEKNRRVELITLPLVTGDPTIWPGMTVAVVSEALEMDGTERCRVAEIQESKAGPYKTTLILELAAASAGVDPNQPPIVAIDYELELETNSDGDAIAVVRLTSDGTHDPDGTIALLAWGGSPVVPTPLGDGTTATAVYDPLPTDPPPTVTLTATDNHGRTASATVAIVATAANSYRRELWVGCGADLDYTDDQIAWATYAVPAAVIAEQAGDEYQLAAGADGVARRVLADGTATALAGLAGIVAFFISRDQNGTETGIAWAAASDGRVWRSVDYGVSWGAVAALPNGGRCNAIQESPYASGDVYAGGGNILYHSYDAGASWQPFHTHPNAAYLITRLASGIAAGATDDPADDAPVMWIGYSGPDGATEARVVERGGSLTHTLPTGASAPLNITGLTISLDAERLILTDSGGDGGRVWAAPTLAGGDLTPQPAYDDVKIEYGVPAHVIRDGRFPIAWGVSVDMAWKTADEGASFIPIRAITGGGRSGRMVGYGRLLPAVAPAPGLFYASAAGAEKALWLWNGTGNDAPPPDWALVAFDDSAWLPSIASGGGGSPAVPADAAPVWADRDGGGRANGEAAAFRRTFTLPDGAVTSATLTVNVDNIPLAVYLNGVYLGGRTDYLIVSDLVFDVARVLIPDEANVIAIHGADHPTGGNVWAAYTLSVNGGVAP